MDELTDDNVRRVFDIAYDIYDKLNLNPIEPVFIEAAPRAVKFRQLMPYSTPQAITAYKEGRIAACEFLKEIGVMSHYDDPRKRFDDKRIKIEGVNNKLLDELLQKLRERLATGKVKNEVATIDNLTYDSEHNQLKLEGKTMDIEGGSLMHYVCKLAFDNRGNKVDGLDIIDEWGGAEKNQSLYDACRAVNKKAKGVFGLDRILVCKDGKVWLNTF